MLSNFFRTIKKVLLSRRPGFGALDQRPFLFLNSLLDTFKLTFLAGLLAVIVGLLLGVYLYLLQLERQTKIYFLLNLVMNLIFATPFLLLVLALVRGILGPYLGWWYGFKVGLICLTMVLTVIFARHCEQIFLQTDTELYWTAYTLGANKRQFVCFFLLPETKVPLILKLNYLFITALSFTNVLGMCGVSSLGQIAYEYGYQGIASFTEQGFAYFDLIWVCVLVIFSLIQIFSAVVNYLITLFPFNRRS